MSDLRSKAAQAAKTPMEEGAAVIASAGTSFAEITHRPEVPDVGGSGIPADLDVPVHVAWSRVMGEVQWIGKGRSEGLKYPFRGIDAVKNAVGPALRKHGVIVMPVSTRAEYSTVNRTGGGVMTYCRATVDYAVIGPRGDRLGGPDFTMQTMGEAFDTGDKSSMKAQSVAERTFYIAGLAIPTDQPAMDPEHGTQYELAGPKVPTPDEYAAMILDERVTLQRLQQIKDELTADRAMGASVVEIFGGEPTRLIDLVQRVGRTKMKESQG